MFVYVCVCVLGSRTAEPSPQGSPTLCQQGSTSEDIWVLRKPLAGNLSGGRPRSHPRTGMTLLSIALFLKSLRREVN